MRNILVTGGAGYVGSAVVEVLKDYTHMKLFVIDSLLYKDDYLEDVNFVRGDVTDEQFISEFLKINDIDTVIHMAGIVGDEACRIHNKTGHAVNVKSVQILVDNFDGLIIFPSSCSVYGSNENILTEESPLSPLTAYAQSKVDAERILAGRDKCVIYRFGTLHGISKRFRNDLVVNTLTLKAIVHGKMSIFGGNQWRPLIHVTDVASTICGNLATEKYGTYNLSTNNHTIIEIAETIKKLIPHTKIDLTQLPFEDQRNYRVSTEKSNSISTFNLFSIEATVNSILKLHKEGRIKNYSDIQYSNIGRMEYTI